MNRRVKKILRILEEYSGAMEYGAYLVGGTVRDIILEKKNIDIDIAVEGDAIRLGETLARGINADIVTHRRFGTCSLVINDSLKLDLAAARTETYKNPGALPDVKNGSIIDDLARRDFTINAMAIGLGGPGSGRLIDPFGGRRDLAKGLIRVMHAKSFIDDPTRIFRAARFESRGGFSIEPATLRLMREAVKKGLLAKVSGPRIANELILILKEPGRLKALDRLSKLGVMKFVHPGIKIDKKVKALFKRADKEPGSSRDWRIYVMALFGVLSYNAALALCNHFCLRRSDKFKILSVKHKT